MSDERTFCGICGVATFDGGSHCAAHKQAPTVERTWCDVCGVATDGAALCTAHEARKLAERQGAAYCERCGRRSPCEAHELEVHELEDDGAGDELEDDGAGGELEDDGADADGDTPSLQHDGGDPAHVAVAIAKTPIRKGKRRGKGKNR